MTDLAAGSLSRDWQLFSFCHRNATQRQKQSHDLVGVQCLSNNDDGKQRAEHGHEIDKQSGPVWANAFDASDVENLCQKRRKNRCIQRDYPTLLIRPDGCLLHDLPSHQRER